jgi:hypothetical protein
MINKSQVSLAGHWKFALDPDGVGIREAWFSRSLPGSIALPGTTDEARIGEENSKMEILRLTRRHPYCGAAFYQKTVIIPEDWRGRKIFFRIERTKPSMLWIDDRLIGEQQTLTTPHLYDASEFLSPGEHRLTVQIDNANLPSIGDSHQVSDNTQTNWNGLLGDIELFAKAPCFIQDLQVYPDIPNKRVRLRLKFNAPCSGRLTVVAVAENSSVPHTVEQSYDNVASGENGVAEVWLGMGDRMQCWDEYNPALYRLSVTFTGEEGEDHRALRIGLRDFSVSNLHFQVNGRTIFLRGKQDACVFPLTGYAPMDTAEWKRVLQISRSYGINHYRFHGWCPPEAAFEAADELGIYLQPELPLWESIGISNVDPMGDVEFKGSGDESVMAGRIRFLVAEGIRILREFGNHPSFCMFALGNELSGDAEIMASIVKRFRQEDPRHLYAQGSNNFIFEPKPGPADDYWTTMMTGGHYRAGVFQPDSVGREARGSFSQHDHAHINNRYPGTQSDYDGAMEGIDLPVIGHEVGQYAVFPRFEEIKKYTGVLRAGNLEKFQVALEKAGMLDLADDFFRASGQLTVLLYREEIETALRSSKWAGFQLLDLQDFPGQGTALVGILDSFMDSKGLITPEAWREFCNDVVLLAKFERYTWTRGATLKAELRLANYSTTDYSNTPIAWMLSTQDGQLVASGKSNPLAPSTGNPKSYESIEIKLDNVECPQKLELALALEGTDYRTSYPLWVYDPAPDIEGLRGSVHLTTALDADALKKLTEGRSVLFCPGNDSVQHAIAGTFLSDFWCYTMFKRYNPPGTLGMLCDPSHPALADFPTEFHSNWQWWPLLRHGCAMVLDELPPGLRPIVHVIDNFERNQRLGVLFECRVGSGKLLVCSCNLMDQQGQPEARQFLTSLLKYAGSEKFQPATSVSISHLQGTFK